jgi:hypothetical protein
MHILLAHQGQIPVYRYGGTERVIWDLGRCLVDLGHRVTYLVAPGSQCDFAAVLPVRPGVSWQAQIPDDVDVAHFQFNPHEDVGTPWLMTEHGNTGAAEVLPANTVFLSANHAQRHGAQAYVYNGMDWRGYGQVDWSVQRHHHHFLGKAAWRVKNVKGAMAVAKRAGADLDVLGGTRLNWRRGFRFTLSPRVHFFGMVGGIEKFQALNRSQGLIFPVRWHEPFGLAVIESLYFGCPVFATPYGALPELVPEGLGCLSTQASELAHAIRSRRFDGKACHDRAVRHFSAHAMTQGYLALYERVLAGETLNTQRPRIQGEVRDLPWAD